MGKNIKLEGEILKKSILYMLLFAIFGVVFGLILSSNFIIFDALYSLLSVALSYITFKISRFINKKDDSNFPFGKEPIEPAFIIAQYIIVLVVLIATLVNSIFVIKNGGNSIDLGWTIVYIALSVVFLLLIHANLNKLGKTAYSPLVDTEIMQWRLSYIQSIGALIAHLVGLVIVWLSFDNLIPFIDPAVLILIVLFLLKTPIVEILKASKELLGMKTISEKLEKDMKNRLDGICEVYGITKSYLRVNKIGSVVFVEIDFLVDKNFKYDSIQQQDMIREKVSESLNLIHYDIWLTIAFTNHIKWAE